jgi:hypothetical protein
MFFSIETVFKEVGAEAKVKFLRICTIEALQMKQLWTMHSFIWMFHNT